MKNMSSEMIQSWHADIVKYENLTSLSRRNRKIFHLLQVTRIT